MPCRLTDSLPRMFALIEAYQLAHPQGARRWLAALPPRCGVVIRRAPAANLAALQAFTRAARAARRCVLMGGCWRLAWQCGVGAHLSERELRRGARLRAGRASSAAVHSLAALRRAQQRRVALIFVSPVFATATHPAAPSLGALRFALWAQRLARQRDAPALYALGGMDAQRWRRLAGARAAPCTQGYGARRAFALFGAGRQAPSARPALLARPRLSAINGEAHP